MNECQMREEREVSFQIVEINVIAETLEIGVIIVGIQQYTDNTVVVFTIFDFKRIVK